jgi:hypothetical protein
MKPPNANPCAECPWSPNSMPGHTGPYNAGVWVELAMSDEPIACHTSFPEDWDETEDESVLRHCHGADVFRSNTCKVPRVMDHRQLPAGPTAFKSPAELIAHHSRAHV